jgi:hypothetical protein
MKITNRLNRWLPVVAVVIVAAISVGCSDQNPTAPIDANHAIQTAGSLVQNRAAQKGDAFACEGLVERVDYKNGVVYFAKGFAVVVPSETVVRLWPSKALIEFSEEYVHAGATVTARGSFKDNGTAIAESLEVHQELGDNSIKPTLN